MNLRGILSIPLTLSTFFTGKIQTILPNSLNTSSFGIRTATTMVLDPTKLNVLHGPLQPHTKDGDSTHPTGYQRDGYCWGIEQDPGYHYIGGIVTKEFLEYSKNKVGNDLMTPRGGFPGLKDGCKWCLCVNRWKEAMFASEKLGEKVVPRVDLSSTALQALKGVSLEDLKKYEYKP